VKAQVLQTLHKFINHRIVQAQPYTNWKRKIESENLELANWTKL